MKIVTVATETNLADLTRRVFAITGAKNAAAAKEAEAALLEANPLLRGMTRVPAGTLLVVPDVPGVSTAAPPTALVNPAVLAQLKQALAAATTMLEQTAASETQAAQATLALTKSREVKSLAKEVPDLQTRLVHLADQTKTQLTQLEAAQATQRQGLALLASNLAALDQG